MSGLNRQEGYVLINVDASFDRQTHSCEIGVVIRDDAGRFIVARNNPILYDIDASFDPQTHSGEIRVKEHFPS